MGFFLCKTLNKPILYFNTNLQANIYILFIGMYKYV